ncbi:MAG: LLM class F420-dependent oxidoreductase, partial [Mycobacteriaceae bacterium]
WTSAMIGYDDLVKVIAKLNKFRAEYGREKLPFEIQVVCIDRFGKAGYQQLEEAGVTDIITMPWIFDGISFDGDIEDKKASIKKFSEEYIEK